LPLQIIHSENGWNTPPAKYQSIGQNTAVLDNITGVIHMLLTRNNTDVFATSSSDEGTVLDLCHGLSGMLLCMDSATVLDNPFLQTKEQSFI
jgi:hypothetical protein